MVRSLAAIVKTARNPRGMPMMKRLALCAAATALVCACASDGGETKTAGAGPAAGAGVPAAAAEAAPRQVTCPVDLATAPAEDAKYCLSLVAQSEQVRGGEAIAAAVARTAFVMFDINSARIKAEYLKNVRALAGLLQDSQLKGGCLRLAGHTDATGTEELNEQLSADRAKALKAALESEGFAAPAGFKLLTTGFGAKKLADPSKPADGVNRRVELIQCPPGSTPAG
jgi:outer membrane protein OmpA-like peptidoglycan-associated protein